ncbi:MAG: hypothetical protein G5663_04195 [Serratia symbiotica]|nr:hypothetical protein [Serratia symbiotica]
MRSAASAKQAQNEGKRVPLTDNATTPIDTCTTPQAAVNPQKPYNGVAKPDNAAGNCSRGHPYAQSLLTLPLMRSWQRLAIRTHWL